MNNPRLPAYVPPREILSRPTAPQINRATTDARNISMTLAGFDEVVPFTFGEDRIPGLWLVRPYTHIGSGHLRFAILWGEGPALGPQEIYINGAAVPGGVTMTHYTGTEGQPIDPTLQADVAGFADSYPFLSYTVFSVPPGTISGFPQTARIECVFRGLLTYDERTDTTYWSENPGLAIGEWLRSTRFGPGINAIGVGAVADRCDSIVAGVEPRCRMGMTFANPIDLEAMMNLLSAYAECLWAFSGDDVLLVPDAPVDEEDMVPVLSSQIRMDSLALKGHNLSSSPTEITVTYRVDTGTSEQWRESSITERLPGVGDREVQAVRSDVNMPGIHRASEAYRKAVFRLRRLQRPGRYEWQMSGIGIKIQQGDVVVLPDTRGMVSETVRVLSAEMIDRGIYQFTGEKYDPLMYPDEAPDSEVNIPVGFISFGLSSMDTPFGWDVFSAADDYLLRGCAPEELGQVAGSNTISHSGTSTAGGGHTGPNDSWRIAPGTDAFDGARVSSLPAPDHDHDYTVNATIACAYRKYKAFVKTGDPGKLPISVMILARQAILDPAFQAVLSSVNRALMAGTTAVQGGSFSSTVAVNPDGVGDHEHHLPNNTREDGDVGFSRPLAILTPAGAHNHNNSPITITANPARCSLMLFQNTVNDKGVVPGIIGGYVGDIENLLPGWHLADGTNGTVDIMNKIIQISDENSSGTSIGDDTYSFGQNLRPDGAHSHGSGTTTMGRVMHQLSHSATEPNHTHTISGSGEYIPRHYKMVFIEYTGVV